MGVQVAMPQQRDQTSMGRRLFAMAAPVAGFALGGPAGAAAGSLIGSKMAGATTRDAALGAAQTGLQAGAKPEAPKTEFGEQTKSMLNASDRFEKPEVGSAFSRRMGMLEQDPKVAIQEGLNSLTGLPKPLRDKYTGVLVKAQMGAGGY